MLSADEIEGFMEDGPPAKPAVPLIRDQTLLSGEQDLAARKGTWRYDPPEKSTMVSDQSASAAQPPAAYEGLSEPEEVAPTPVAAQPVIVAEGLKVTFLTNDGPVHALKDIDLTINKGDFVSFIGPSGCGKTTFLRAVAALEHPTGGSLIVNGMSPDAARRARAYGYVFQAAGLYPWRTIARNIQLPLEIMGFSKTERQDRTQAVLKLVELENFGNKYPWQLSGGMQQRASIARALAFDADILLMDEPFGALDEIVRDHLNEQLLSLWGRTGKTIGFVTHSIPEAVYLSTKIVVMSPRPGRITDVIDSPLPRERPLDIRDTPEFLMLAHRVREGLRAGHAYDD